MTKTHAVLVASVAALAACAHNQPAASAPTTASSPTASRMGAPERMPSDSPSSSAATGELPDETPGASNAEPTSNVPPSTSWTDGQILDVIHEADQGEDPAGQTREHA